MIIANKFLVNGKSQHEIGLESLFGKLRNKTEKIDEQRKDFYIKQGGTVCVFDEGTFC